MNLFLGFDPGGAGGFGCALLDEAKDGVLGVTVASVDEAVDWASSVCSNRAPYAAGIDTLLFWQSTRSGWRGADCWLRRAYPEQRNSVICSNGLYGSMSVQGALLGLRLRELWPQLRLTETHPKVLWSALRLGRYPRLLEDSAEAYAWRELAGLGSIDIKDEHQLDAAISAWAARMGFSGRWPHDLADESAPGQKRSNAALVYGVRYFWPE